VKFIDTETHYGVHRNLPLGTILGEVNPIYIFASYFYTIYFNIIF